MNKLARNPFAQEQKRLMRRAAKLEWISVGYAACTITVVALVVGNSQAMRTAWVEDMLSVLPQLAFLIALRWTRKPRRPRQPYGYHRSMGAGHLVAGVALLVVGAMLAYESITALVKTEHPTIGTVNLFGHTIWQGWPMIAVMTVIVIPALILGRLKIKVAKPLHNKLLYADSKMAKGRLADQRSFHRGCCRNWSGNLVAGCRGRIGHLARNSQGRLGQHTLSDLRPARQPSIRP